MRLLCKQTATLKRHSSKGVYNDKGDWVAGSVTSSQIKCSIQPPFGGNSFAQTILPKGVETKDAATIYTKIPLRTTSEQDGIQGDLITIDGSEYMVHSVDKWDSATCRLSHYKALIIKKDKLSGYN